MPQDVESLQKRTAFLRDCFMHDNRELSINHFFKTDIEARFVVEPKEELLNDAYPKVPVPDAIASDLKELTVLYKQEKQLVYCSLFVKYDGPENKVLAPLLIYNAEFSEGEFGSFVSINQFSPVINKAALNALSFQNTNGSEWMETLYEKVNGKPLTEDVVLSLQRWFSKTLVDVQTDDLLHFPELRNEKQLKKKAQTPQMVSASAVGVIKRSVRTRGILGELRKLAKGEHFSAPLRRILTPAEPNEPKSTEPTLTTVNPSFIPAILSDAQLELLRSAKENDLTTVIGPPGTGKSFSIAALAVNHMLQGKSVLIASKTEEAIAVIHQKIEQDLGAQKVGLLVNSKEQVRLLKWQLQKYLTGVGLDKTVSKTRVSELKERIVERIAELQQCEKRIHRNNENIRKAAQFRQQSGMLSWLRKTLAETRVDVLGGYFEQYDQIYRLEQERMTLSARLVEDYHNLAIADTLRNDRQVISALHRALKKRTDFERKAVFEEIDHAKLFKALPIWLVTTHQAANLLPFEMDLFDLVIVDEASQCDTASILPLIQRAKKGVICGDPNQLSHISFLSRGKQLELARKNQLEADDFNYRDESVLDLSLARAQSSTEVIFLDEHYRSHPSIIHFSNRHFYSNGLKVMTWKPTLSKNDGLFHIPIKGKQASNGVNKEEADRILEDLHEHFSNGTEHSVGVVSPFRNQVEYLKKVTYKAFGAAQFERFNLLIGTPYEFQGNERDVMHLSFALGDDSHPMAYRYLDNANVFNVAITRAKKIMKIYTSFTHQALKPHSLTSLYLSAFDSYRPKPSNQHPNTTVGREFCEVLNDKNVQYWVGQPIAGMVADILCQYNHHFTVIDLIDADDHTGVAYSLDTLKSLMRMNITIVPLSEVHWQHQRKNTIEKLLGTIMRGNEIDSES